MSINLLPCPFCGHESPEFERMGDRRQSCIVICGWCGARHESSDEGDRCGSSWNQRAEPSQDGLRVLEQAARMLRKYHRLCVELGRGDSYWLGEILATEAALLATPSAPTAVEPDEPLKWCSYCGEGVTTFCRGKQSPDWDYKCPVLNLPARALKGTP